MNIDDIWRNFLIENNLNEEIFLEPNQVGGNLDLQIEERGESECILFNCKQINYNIKFSNCLKTFGEAQDEINNMFSELHQRFISKLKTKNDLIRISFSHDSFDSRVSIPFMGLEDLTRTNLQNAFDYVIQSYREITVNENNSFSADIIIAYNVSGSRKRKENRKVRNPKKAKKVKIDEYTQQDRFLNSSGIIPIYNSDNFCAIRAVIISIAYYNKNNDKKNVTLNKLYSQLIKNNSSLLNRQVEEIKIKYKLKDEPGGIILFQILEDNFKDYQITIYKNDGKLDKTCVFKGDDKLTKYIYISWIYTSV